MNLLAFSCSSELVPFFCDRVEAAGSAALILKKQEDTLREVLRSYGIREVYALPEDFYGNVTSDETKKLLAEIHEREFIHAYFPLNDFCGNVALLLATLVAEVIAKSATAPEQVEVRLPSSEITWRVGHEPDPSLVSQVQSKIVRRLKSFSARIEAIAGDRAGEKPTVGLIANYPYDCEILYRYAYAATQVTDDVLEIGCGLGYGAYMMTELNPGIRVKAVDNDPHTVQVARELWRDNDRLTFDVAQAEDLPFETGSFDNVVCFEVIEHLQQPEQLMQEVRRVLAQGGILLGSTPNARLYQYRVNTGLPGAAAELRQAGVWPWHLQEFDEASTLALMERFGLEHRSIVYPTFTKGIDLYNHIRRSNFPAGVESLSNLKWSAADFSMLDSYCPCFSGFSFVFAGSVEKQAPQTDEEMSFAFGVNRSFRSAVKYSGR